MPLCQPSFQIYQHTAVRQYNTSAEDGARVYDFTDQNISCLKFDVEKVDVQIQPSADENSYMELYDFGTGTYDISRSNNWLTITNESGLSSLYQVLEDQENNEGGSSFLGLHLDNFRFRGLRYFFRFSPGHLPMTSAHQRLRFCTIFPENYFC